MLLPLFAAACAAGPADDPAASAPPPDEAANVAPAASRPAVESTGFQIPVDFRPECAYLKQLTAPPPTLTVKAFFGCLTDDSRAKLDRSFSKKAARRAVAGAPASLAEVVALHGDAVLAGARLRDLAFGSGDRARAALDVQGAGLVPGVVAYSASTPSFGLDPSKCEKSCLSAPVAVVGDTRVIGYRAASIGPDPSPTGVRLLDEIFPGKFPDHNQNDLADPELVAAGCGPVSAVNLLEWWNLPVWNGGSHLTSFDARTNFIAGRMDTLEGINYTDDDDLIDFMKSYPKELYDAGRVSGYPGWHYMRDDANAFKVMLSYIARGYPVIALYASGSMSLHWAMIAGYQDGKLLIANAGDRTLADFYNQWDDWEALAWYASWAAEAVVDQDTFFAYTGWNSSSTPQPDRFAARGAANPGYSASGTTYRWRYCVGDGDEIGQQAEADHVPIWSREPDGDLPGYCMYEAGMPSFKLSASGGGAAASARGATIDLAVTGGGALSDFIAANPGAHCNFFGKSGGTWTTLAIKQCGDAGALRYSFTNSGQYSEVTFQIHAAELAHVTWTIKTS